MTEEVKEEGMSVGISGGSIQLSLEEVQKLIRLTNHEGFAVLKDILVAIKDAATVTLRDRNCGIEDLRYAQGGSSAACDLADLLVKDIHEWYTEKVARRSDDA